MSYLGRKRNKKEKGFTLIELVIVIAIIGFFMAIAIPNYMTARQTAAINASKVNLRNLATALELYMAENNLSEYPKHIDTGDKSINKVLQPYFPGGAPKNPAGSYYHYTSTDGKTFLISDPSPYPGETANSTVYYGVGPGGSIKTITQAEATGGKAIDLTTTT